MGEVMSRVAVVVLVLSISCGLPAAAQAPSNVLVNGKIVTLDALSSVREALAIRDGEIIAVGDSAQIRQLAAPTTRVIDLGGRTVIPGLIDGHTHFVRTAQAPGPFIEGLESAASIADLRNALAAAARKAEPGEWVVAIGGFTPIQFAERRMPTREELSKAVPDHPVYMQVGYSTRGVVNDAGRRALELGLSRPPPLRELQLVPAARDDQPCAGLA